MDVKLRATLHGTAIGLFLGTNIKHTDDSIRKGIASLLALMNDDVDENELKDMLDDASMDATMVDQQIVAPRRWLVDYLAKLAIDFECIAGNGDQEEAELLDDIYSIFCKLTGGTNSFYSEGDGRWVGNPNWSTCGSLKIRAIDSYGQDLWMWLNNIIKHNY